MKINRLLLIIIFCLIILKGFAQSDSLKQKRMIYGIGYSHFRLLDQQNSPLIYRGHLLDLNIGFEKIKIDKSIFNVKLNLVGGIANSKRNEQQKVINYYYDENNVLHKEIIPLVHPELLINLSTEYLIKYKNLLDNKATLYVGGQIREFFHILYLATWGFDMPSILNEFTLNPKLLFEYKFNDLNKFNTSLSFPVFGLITRLPYSNVPMIEKYGPFMAVFKGGTNFSAINKYQRFDIELGWEKVINIKWNIHINYCFMWLHFPEVLSIKAYSNTLEFQFIRKLK